MLNRRNWVILPLLSTGIVLIVFICSARAALLKDIRVGEYDSFTRVVFELDAPEEPEQIIRLSPDQLSLVLPDTAADLIRKIPVERSRHIKSIQIWDKENQLSAVLRFDFNHFKHQSFLLKNPPRIVLDVQPLEGVPADAAAQSPRIDEPETSNAASPNLQRPSSPAVASEDIVPNRAAAETAPAPPAPGMDQTEPAPTLPSYIKNSTEPASESADTTPAASPGKPQKTSHLQFYLVVGLVLITIVILVLLLLMLLSRHRWAEDNSRLSAKEFLTNQERHIASLDARIQEQLKRYEEA